MKTTVNLILACSLIGLFIGCSDLKETLPAATQTIGVHPSGWLTKTSSDFHGQAIQGLGWDMRSCRNCHGGEYDGGVSGYSCRTCHTETLGPQACNVCHGSTTSAAPPTDLDGNTDVAFRGVGEHQIHLLGTARTAAVGCASCHQLPSGDIYDPAHIDANPDGRAEINFSGIAKRATSGTNPSPIYYETSGACDNTYCHGAFKNGNGSNPMFWNGGAVLAAACGSCHGDITKPTLAERALPKTSANGGTHPNNTACSNCHGDVVNSSLGFVDPSKHVNGVLNVFGTVRNF